MTCISDDDEEGDIFYLKAKKLGWRARSAFKLLQIDKNFDILKDVTRAVDLCAAPGSWSQVLSRKLYQGEDVHRSSTFFVHVNKDLKKAQCKVNKSVKIVAVDKMHMFSLPGVTQLQGDILHYSTALEIISQFDGAKADLVVCDGAPEITGNHSMDVYMHSNLLLGALHIAFNVLKDNGIFVAKIFEDKENYDLKSQMHIFFKSVDVFKPSGSRKNNREAYVMCRKYSPPEGFDPTKLAPYLDPNYRNFDELVGINRFVIPFLIEGDLSMRKLDSSLQLQLERDYPYLFSNLALLFEIEKIQLTPEIDELIKKQVNEGNLITEEHVKEYEQLKETMCETHDKVSNSLNFGRLEFDEDSFAILKRNIGNNLIRKIVPKNLRKFKTVFAKEVREIEAGETKPNDNETNSNSGETQPNDNETNCNNCETNPNDNETNSNNGETTRNDNETNSNNCETNPDDNETNSNNGETNDAETKPNDGETKPDDGETKPNDVETDTNRELKFHSLALNKITDCLIAKSINNTEILLEEFNGMKSKVTEVIECETNMMDEWILSVD